MLNISSRQLRIFVSAAKHLNFTRAAEEVHISPPAISMQIKEIESHLGAPLFNREKKNMYLSAAGEYFLNCYSSANNKIINTYYYVCEDKINDLIVAPVAGQMVLNAIIGCQDK